MVPVPRRPPLKSRPDGMPVPFRGKKGTVPICAKHPEGRSGGHRPKVGRGLSPFSLAANSTTGGRFRFSGLSPESRRAVRTAPTRRLGVVGVAVLTFFAVMV